MELFYQCVHKLKDFEFKFSIYFTFQCTLMKSILFYFLFYFLFYIYEKHSYEEFVRQFGYKICEGLIYNHLMQLYSTHCVNTYSFFVYIMHQESQNNADKPQMQCFISLNCPFLFNFFLSNLKCFGNRLFYKMNTVIYY